MKSCISYGYYANIMIIAAEFLGFNESIKPFAIANDRDILKGVNYASGAAGIREETGWQLVYSLLTNFI